MNFYQLIPLYKEEIDFKREHGVDELLEKCSDETLEVIDPQRLNVITDADKIDYDDALMESAEEHIKVIEEKKLPIGELAAYNHLAIYLRWSIEHDFMSNPFPPQPWRNNRGGEEGRAYGPARVHARRR